MLVEDKKDRTTEEVAKEKEVVDQQMNQNMYAQLLPGAPRARHGDDAGDVGDGGGRGVPAADGRMPRHGHARDGIPAGILIDDSSRHDRALEL